MRDAKVTVYRLKTAWILRAKSQNKLVLFVRIQKLMNSNTNVSFPKDVTKTNTGIQKNQNVCVFHKLTAGPTPVNCAQKEQNLINSKLPANASFFPKYFCLSKTNAYNVLKIHGPIFKKLNVIV